MARTPPAPVEVVWMDAHGGHEGWGGFEARADHKARRVRTVGLLIRDDTVGITVALSYDAATDSIDSSLFIPRAMVESLTPLVAGPVRRARR